MNIAYPMIAYLRTRVGSIEESNIHRDEQVAYTTRIVAEHRRMIADQERILVAHDQRLAY